MTVEIDGLLFEAQQERCSFTSGLVDADGSSEPTHFSEAPARVFVPVYVSLRSARPPGPPQPSLTVFLEDSADGVSWAIIETFPFTGGGIEQAAVDSPRAYLRARWEIEAGTWELTVYVLPLAPADGAGASQLQTVTVNLTSEEVASLSEGAFGFGPTPADTEMLVPVAASWQYRAGTEPFANPDAQLRIIQFGGEETLLASDGNLHLTGLDNWISAFAQSAVGTVQAGAAGSPLALYASPAPGLTGSILAASLNAGGAGYAPGDTGTITKPLTGDVATYEIDTVGDGGAVETFHITAAGTQYGVAAGLSTAATTGGGDGNFTVNVDTITPLSDGTARLTVLYYVMDLA